MKKTDMAKTVMYWISMSLDPDSRIPGGWFSIQTQCDCTINGSHRNIDIQIKVFPEQN